MPSFSFINPKIRSGDRGALMVYIIIALMIIMATTFAGGSIALSDFTHIPTYHPNVVVIQGSVTNPTPTP